MERSLSKTDANSDVILEEDNASISNASRGIRSNSKKGSKLVTPYQGKDLPPIVFQYRIIILGNSQVGKSETIGALIGQPYSTHRTSTGSDMILFKYKVFTELNYSVLVEFWDPCAQSSQTELMARLCGDIATAFVLMFSVTNLESYEDLDTWVQAFNLLRDDGQFCRPTILIGNKLDLVDDGINLPNHVSGSNFPSATNSMINLMSGQGINTTSSHLSHIKKGKKDIKDKDSSLKRVVTFDDAQTWAMNRGAEYYETSAITQQNLDIAFNMLIKNISRQLPTDNYSDPKSLVDLRIRPVKPLTHDKHIEYKNHWTRHICIDDTTDEVDWL